MTVTCAPVTRAHGDPNRYRSGPGENDEPGEGCRCQDCRAGNARAGRGRRYAIAAGHPPMIDAQPVRDHVRALQDAGLSWKRIADMAGVAHNTIRSLLYGTRGYPPTRHMRRRVAHKILAVQLDQIPDKGWVAAVGTSRRLQALAVGGWSAHHLAARLGMSKWNLQALTSGGPQRRVDVKTARAVRALYDRLWDVDPATAGISVYSTAQTRVRAARLGWVPPMAWDDDQIDDPAAVPDLGERVHRFVALAEDAAELAEQGFTPRQQAERLGVTDWYLAISGKRAAKREAARAAAEAAHG